MSTMLVLLPPKDLRAERVRVHFNLHTHLWSITAMDGERRGRVVAHYDGFALTGCRLIVSQAGRNRVLAQRCRLVHAWVEGLAAPFSYPPTGAVGFTYNPYRAATFTRRDTGAAIESAARCWFMGEKAYVEMEP